MLIKYIKVYSYNTQNLFKINYNNAGSYNEPAAAWVINYSLYNLYVYWCKRYIDLLLYRATEHTSHPYVINI